jgi:2-keto-4-pentenoate hydratase/2-oxohepta-3-ene-1,7-dioic acid hydratase in catechol pathway
MHVFLDAGGGNVLAFFELPNQPEMGRDPATPAWVQHLAFKVADEAALLSAKAHIEAQGIDVLGPTWHGLFKSIYFFDPNGHRLELACIGTSEQVEKAREVAPAMLEEWAQTRRAPRHAAWLLQPRSPGVIDHTHDPRAQSWVEGAAGHADFPVQNLPLGVFSRGDGARRIATRSVTMCSIWQALPRMAPCRRGCLPRWRSHAQRAVPPARADRIALRHALFALLSSERCRLKVTPHLHASDAVTLHLPFAIGDYTDFYVGIHHATAIGKLFRPDNPLLPNYKHVPIGYHGRASSVRVSGTPVTRPWGQLKAPDAAAPEHAPCRRLDHELELGLWIAGDNDLGQPVPIADAWSRIGGLCLLNDWSARDIQAWEYQPLGPFLAKNFATTVSPWVITAQALAPFRVAPPPPGWRSGAHALSARKR